MEDNMDLEEVYELSYQDELMKLAEEGDGSYGRRYARALRKDTKTRERFRKREDRKSGLANSAHPGAGLGTLGAITLGGTGLLAHEAIKNKVFSKKGMSTKADNFLTKALRKAKVDNNPANRRIVKKLLKGSTGAALGLGAIGSAAFLAGAAKRKKRAERLRELGY